HRDLHSFPTRRSSDLWLDAVRRAVLALRARNRHVVDVRSMQIHAAELSPGQLLELGHRADARVVIAVVTAPHGDRSAPVAITRQDRKSTRLNSSHLVI